MLKKKSIDKICIAVAAAAVAVVIVFMKGESLGIARMSGAPEYEKRLFDDSRVHRVDIEIEDWDEFINKAPEEEYSVCDIIIDGERTEKAGIRAKGNNSLNLTEKYGHERYSLKVEFDHYVEGGSYLGLDKMSLDASFQDNSYMKNYLAYDMMSAMGVPAPLCSYVWVTVNGRDWGLFLAVEEPEEAFARRVYGRDHGKLYKPDYMSLEDENADVALRYTGDEVNNYENIFRNAKFDIASNDKKRVIEALKNLSQGENLEKYVDVEGALRYFTVQTFVVNLDSYLGPTGHNYYLYEENGRLTMLPWDYNLAFGTYSLGMPQPVNDAELYVNYPIDTPYSGEVMMNRPFFHNIMKKGEYYEAYHMYYDQFLREYFESGYFETRVRKTAEMIAPYAAKDPTAYCSYEEHAEAVDTIENFCLLRAQSVRKQLEGQIPSTVKGQSEDRSGFVDASSVWIPHMGEIADLK
ncbi:MAG TPA: CotH kinase family protein [Candidatus Copromorpha excrementigallinarum]|uniref:CotH kinase family protein n=1 Tax=Candidatus Allocopromorpha excrementigallinarum TaxID=2840742 RepID=A0A9D1I149_9FIRM|nr:CotH kinase family protein [Candidatus Copromorpha excrementigallinarum]